jgi:hypothetical protein
MHIISNATLHLQNSNTLEQQESISKVKYFFFLYLIMIDEQWKVKEWVLEQNRAHNLKYKKC